jgi:septum formation protein
VEVRSVDEVFPPGLQREQIPLHLAALKSAAFADDELQGRILLTADTIVWHNGRELGKPRDLDHAREMLFELSGSTHEVYTAIRLRSAGHTVDDSDLSRVTFRPLSHDEVEHYVTHYRPLDKAGSYGIQEWIGYVGIERIEGCYFNVMGLPLRKVWGGIKVLLNG